MKNLILITMASLLLSTSSNAADTTKPPTRERSSSAPACLASPQKIIHSTSDSRLELHKNELSHSLHLTEAKSAAYYHRVAETLVPKFKPHIISKIPVCLHKSVILVEESAPQRSLYNKGSITIQKNAPYLDLDCTIEYAATPQEQSICRTSKPLHILPPIGLDSCYSPRTKAEVNFIICLQLATTARALPIWHAVMTDPTHDPTLLQNKDYLKHASQVSQRRLHQIVRPSSYRRCIDKTLSLALGIGGPNALEGGISYITYLMICDYLHKSKYKSPKWQLDISEKESILKSLFTIGKELGHNRGQDPVSYYYRVLGTEVLFNGLSKAKQEACYSIVES